MAKEVSYKEFLVMCGTKERPLSYQTLHSAVRRGHVKVNKDAKTVNPNLKINKEWMAARKQLAAKKSRDANQQFTIINQQKKLQLKKVEEEYKIARIKRQQLEGELIPTELVGAVFATHFKSITKAFHNAAVQIATDAVKRLKGNEKDLAWLKGYLIPVINEAVKKGKIVSEKEIKNIVHEYSKQNK